MVSFVCYYCDRTMKKKQVERHGYQCGRPMKVCCIDCRKWFDGDAYKAHTSCISEEQQWHGKFWKGHKNFSKQKGGNNKPKDFYKKANETTTLLKNKKAETDKQAEAEVEQVSEWNGWKKTIRKLVKGQSGRSISTKNLRKECRRLYKKANENQSLDKKMFKKLFNQKLMKAKNLKIEDEVVSYSKN